MMIRKNDETKRIKKTIERIICLAMCLSLLGCGRTNALSEVDITGQEKSTDNAEDSMETESMITFGCDSQRTSEVDKKSPIEEFDESQDTVTVCLPQYKRYGEIISINTEENLFTSAVADNVDSSYDLGSFIFDLDKDGKEEAIVVNGLEEEPDNPDYDRSCDYWYIEHAWIVDNDGEATEIQDFSKGYVAVEQYLLDTDSGNFITLNGYMGMDGIGVVYTSKDGKIVSASEDMWLNGQKFFISDNELLWNIESYNAFCMVISGLTPNEAGGGGRSHMPYKMYRKGNEFYLYDAKEISLEEAQRIADIDIGGIVDCGSAQFILRDNNELDVNFVVRDIPYYYNFYTNIYYLSEDKSAWELNGTVEGYMDVDLKSDNNWEVLSEKM